MNRLLAALLCAWGLTSLSGALAEAGPRVPVCDGCPEPTSDRPFPRTGFWFDPQRSGSGFTLEVQDGVLAGAYYGFTDSGERLWYTFAGQLEPSTQSGELWTVQTDLLSFRGGNCIGCTYRPSDPPQAAPQLTLRVLQRNLISYAVDDGPEFRVQPLVYGSDMPALIDEFPSLGFLVLEDDSAQATPWAIVRRRDRSSLQLPGPTPTSGTSEVAGRVFSRGFSRIAGAQGVVETRFYWQGGHPAEGNNLALEAVCGHRDALASLPVGRLPAGVIEDIADGSACVITSFLSVLGSPATRYYFAPLANFGDDYFFATDTNGDTIEGIRLRYQ